MPVGVASVDWEPFAFKGAEDTLDAFILRDESCTLHDEEHGFDQVRRVEVERDTSLAFWLTCKCVVALQDALGGGVITVE